MTRNVSALKSHESLANLVQPDSSFWHRRRVFITGGSGLVGSRLVADLLRARADVTVLMRDQDERSALSRSGDLGRIDIVRGSLESYTDIERAVAESGSSVVFHLGAQTIVGVGIHAPLLTFESNIRGTYNVLEVCRRHPSIIERVVIASSDKAYGPSDHAYDENDALRPTSPYDVSKAAADLLAQSYYATYGLRVAILRCGNTYGGGDLNWSRLIPGTIRSFHYGEAPEIRSDGTFVRDYIHVADAARAYRAVAEALHRDDVIGQAFNVAAGTRATVLEIVQAITELMGGDLPLPRVLGLARDEIREQRLSTDKVRRVVGWVPSVGLTEGLRDTIDWYRSYLGAA